MANRMDRELCLIRARNCLGFGRKESLWKKLKRIKRVND
jgi:hypothetical protein